MKPTLLCVVALLMVCLNDLSAQGCVIQSDYNSRVAKQGDKIYPCIDQQTGVIKGNIFVSANVDFVFPQATGEIAQLRIGPARLILFPNSTATIPIGMPIDPTATNFIVQGFRSTQNSSFFFDGQQFFQRMRVDQNVSFPAGQQAVRDAAARALPISLLSWEAEVTGTGIDLNWASESETDNDFYLIEHSLDGRSFTELTRVPGQVSSEGTLTYTFHHANPGPGTHYYRLSQQDLDGTMTSFDVLTVNYGDTAAARLFPNPALPGDVLTLGTEAGDVSLYHIDGRRIAEFTTPAGSRPQITLPGDLAPGVYLLRQGTETSRLLVR